MNDTGGAVPTKALSACCGMTEVREDSEKRTTRRDYDLSERTARFAETVIRFAKTVPGNPVTASLITQLVKAGTSVGANYQEADNAVSKRDFRNKIGICRKESAETKYWLRMIVVAEPSLKEAARPLWQEAKELNLIFAQSFHTAADSRPG
ncbi:MAG: four helix bundle protein [Phycisphaerae bacterium]